MYIIKIDEDVTLAALAEVLSLPISAVISEDNYNIAKAIILKHPKCDILTNIMLGLDDLYIIGDEGIIDGKAYNNLALYVPENFYDVADALMEVLYDNKIRSMMMNI